MRVGSSVRVECKIAQFKIRKMRQLTMREKLRSFVFVTVSGIGFFGAFEYYRGNPKFYKNFVVPMSHLLEPEKAHKLAVFASKHRLIPRSSYVDPDVLNVEIFGKRFSNPIGIAAGFDKHGEAALGLQDIGFGFVEIGSVTPKPQPGNEQPRLFRLKDDEAVINRYGFNSDGHQVVFKRVEDLKASASFNRVLGVNLGVNKDSENVIDDYVEGVKKFGPVADYLVVNVSSPNTAGLRSLQLKSSLQELLTTVLKTRNNLKEQPAVFLKLAPDLSSAELEDVAQVVKQPACRVDGLIICNTTIQRPGRLESNKKEETGGLSGKPIKDMSTKMIADMYKLTDGMTIIGVGGVSCGEDAYEKIKAGAYAVQLYTALVYEGFPVVEKIKKELAELLIADNHSKVSEAVGKSVR